MKRTSNIFKKTGKKLKNSNKFGAVHPDKIELIRLG